MIFTNHSTVSILHLSSDVFVKIIRFLRFTIPFNVDKVRSVPKEKSDQKIAEWLRMA